MAAPIIPMKFPKDELANIARQVYMPDVVADDYFKNGRKLYAEIFDVNLNAPLHNVCINELAIKALAQNFNGEKLNEKLTDYDLILFGQYLDVDLHLEKIFHLSNDVYWKRVAESYCSRKIDLLKRRNWKMLAIEFKLEHLLANTSYELWQVEELQALAQKLCPYVRKLNIRNLKTLKDFALEKNASNADCKIYNYSDAMLSHGNLSFLAELKGLQSLSVSFYAENLKLHFHKRYFRFSTSDVINLASALSKLPNLKYLTLRGNQFKEEHLKTLLLALHQSHIKRLDLSFCGIDSTAIQPLAVFLYESNCSSLEYLELKGNTITGAGITTLASALVFFKGFLKYLGLSQNPVESNGAAAIMDAICMAKNVEYIDLSFCDLGVECANAIPRLIQEPTGLRKLDISSVLVVEEIAFQMVKALFKNYTLELIDCRKCGLSKVRTEQIETLLRKNHYYVENPLLLKSHFTEQDERQIEELVANWQQPLLEKARTKAINLFKYFEPKEIESNENNLIDENKFVCRARI